MIKLDKLKRLIEIGCVPSDSPEERLRKSIMTIMVIPYSLAGIIWGLYFMRNGFAISGVIPLAYAVVSTTSFLYFIYTKRYNIFRFFQVFLVLVLPFFLQLTLGGFSQSSGMLLWSCTAPFIALVFYDVKTARKWFVALFFTLVLACFLDELARSYFSEDIDESSIVYVYGANFILISFLLFGIQIYFVNGQKKIKIELEEKEELLKASAEIEKQKSLLSVSKGRLELVMGALEEVVWGRNLPDYQMQYVSDSVVKLYGFPVADWYENPNLWTDMIHPDDIQQVEKDNEPLFSVGVTELEYRIITLDKEIKWISSSTRIIKSTDGTPFFMTGIAQDITAQKTAQEKILKQKSLLSVSKDRLELVMGALEEVVWGRNLPDYQMQYVSDSVVKLYGFPMADWYENPNLWMDMIHPDDLSQVEKDGESLFTKGITELEYRIITPDKEIKWIHSTTRILKSTDGTPYFMTGIAQDITGQKNAKEQLKQLNDNLEEKVKYRTIELEESLEREKELGKLKSSFVSTASHQFRTPLAAIQSNSELLQMLAENMDEEASKGFKKATNRIKGEIDRMTELMDDVLMLGKLTSGNVDYKPQELNLVDFCKNLVKEFDDIQSDGRVMNILTKGEPYNVLLDPKLLTHSLSNLFSNAFKYSSGKNNPELSVSFKPKEFVLMVRDYGIGIPKEELSKLFQPFFRANNVIEIKGTGLGLSIAKEYIEINKGILTASSTEGIGSKFEISFKK